MQKVVALIRPSATGAAVKTALEWTKDPTNEQTLSSVEVVEQMDLNKSKCSSSSLSITFFGATFILREMSDIKYAFRKVRNTLLLGTITDTLTICEKTQNPKEKSTEMLLKT